MNDTFYVIAGVALVIVLVGFGMDWYYKAGRASLFTIQGGFPKMVDQIAEQRRKALHDQQIHRAVSPHAESPYAEERRRALQPHIERELQARRNGRVQ